MEVREKTVEEMDTEALGRMADEGETSFLNEEERRELLEGICGRDRDYMVSILSERGTVRID